jgi:hypothetical protein
VEAEVGLDDLADLARLHGEDGVLEGLDHGATTEVVEVPAPLGRARIVGVGPRQRLEFRRLGAQLREQALGLLACLGALGRRLVGLGDDQDVVGAPLLGGRPSARVLVVVAPQVGLGDVDVAPQRLQPQRDVLDARLLGGAEERFVGLVKGLELGVGGLHLAQVGGAVEALNLDLALLQQGVQRHGGDLLRCHHAARHPAEHLLHAEFGAQLGREHLRAHALGGQDVAVDAAVRVAQAGELRVGHEQALQPLVGREQVACAGLGQQHALAHDRLEGLPTHFRRVQQRHVHPGHLLAHAVDAALMRQIPLGLRDLEPVDLRHAGVGRVGHVAVALDAEEDERRDDQEHDQAEHQPGVRTDEFEHRGAWVGRVRDGSQQQGRGRTKRRRRTAVRLPFRDSTSRSRCSREPEFIRAWRPGRVALPTARLERRGSNGSTGSSGPGSIGPTGAGPGPAGSLVGADGLEPPARSLATRPCHRAVRRPCRGNLHGDHPDGSPGDPCTCLLGCKQVGWLPDSRLRVGSDRWPSGVTALSAG